MPCLTLAILLLPFCAAEVGLHERRHVMDGKRIVLSSRGDASYEHSGDERPEHSSQDDANHEEAGEYIQVVNGSTPTGYVDLGTPRKKMLAIFDTGSDKFVAKTWETLEAEMASFDPSSEGLVQPTFLVYDHNTSKTYDHKMVWKNETKEWVPKMELISYGSGMAETIDGQDTLQVGGHSIENMSLSEITADSLELLHTTARISAVMGLQHMRNRSLGSSVFSTARDKGMFTSFGYCVDPRGREADADNGTFIWGDKSTEGTKLDVVGDMHWAVRLGSMRVIGAIPRNETRHGDNDTADAINQKFKDVTFTRGEPVRARLAKGDPHTTRGSFGSGASPYHEVIQEDDEVVSPTEAICANNSCCGILDTGSNIIAGPEHLMKAIANQVNVDPFCKNYEHLPEIELVFGGMKVNISKEGYVMRVPVPQWAGNGDDAGDTQTLGKDEHKSADEDKGDEAASSMAMPTKRWSLNQFAARQTSKQRWKAVFERLYEERGIDFRPVMRDFLENDNGTDSDSAELMCMPALVPLDKHTKYGPLFVVGTPLLATHYARWSFDKNATHPAIHLKKLEDCERCKHVAPSSEPKLLQAGSQRSFIRSETQGTVPAIPRIQKSSGPFIRNIDDIRFPHWARHITDI